MTNATGWIERLLVLAAAAFSTLSGVVSGFVTLLDEPASVSEQAERGEQDPASQYGLPVAAGDRAGWADTHSSYPATDIFVGCGATLISPVHGSVLEVRRVDSYVPADDNPATRGGRSVSILGIDGVRYYMAHFDEIVTDLEPGDPVETGQVLGTMGDTGRTSACHLHFSISPPCPGKEWSVRRGVVWPSPYLDAWRAGEPRSPAEEVERWVLDHPDACAEAMADPFAGDA